MVVLLLRTRLHTKIVVAKYFKQVLTCKRYASGVSYRHHVGTEALILRTVGGALDVAAQMYGDREAIVSCHEGRRYTFREVRDKANQIAAGFVSAGLQRGDRIGMWGPNSTLWYLTMMAASRVGLILVGINPGYQASEMEFCLNKVGVKGIVAPETFKTTNYYETLLQLAPELAECSPGNLRSSRLPNLKTVIIAGDKELPGALNFANLPSLASAESIQIIRDLESAIQPDDGCNIQFTSGTTGHPKGTLLSHFNLVNNAYQVGKRNELAGNESRICVQVPLFHAFGVVISTLAALQHGATIVLPGASFKPEESLQTIEKEKCTVVHGTPTMYVDLISKQKEINANLDTLQIAITGGAPCSPRLFNQMLEVLKVNKVKSVFGMTETTAVIFQSLPGESAEKATSTVGHVQDHVEVKVIDEVGRTVPLGRPGELCVRGYVNMLEYWDDQAKTAEMVGPDRWLKTGDQFVLEEDGYGRIVGRLKEMIIRGGENIFPKEIEDFVNTHPQVLETHVLGVADDRMGEEVCAFVRLRQGAVLTQSDLSVFCKGRIAHFKVPKYVIPVETFPTTTSGKIQKFKLKRIAEEKGLIKT